MTMAESNEARPYVVQFLLPLSDNEGAAFPAAAFRRIHDELVAKHGGVTAFTQSPAQGAWREEDSGGSAAVVHDQMVLFEVMVAQLDRQWWAAYRAELEKRFRQAAIIVRAIPVETL